GIRMQPRLVTSVVSASGVIAAKFDPKQVGIAPISADTLGVLDTAMIGATLLAGATAQGIFADIPFPVAGKTGTAEAGGSRPPYAWFTGFAPAAPLNSPPVDPKLAAAALVAYSGFGGEFAAPVINTMLKAYPGYPFHP